MRFSQVMLAVVVLVACRGAAGGTTPEECAPGTGELPASGTAAGLEGEYHLRLVATSGAKTGSTVGGALTLEPQSQTLLYRSRPEGAPDTTWRHSLYGSADLDLAAVDAVELGSTTSMDPMQPGVLVMERNTATDTAPNQVVIRLGSEANRRDRQRFDGGYMALRVLEADNERFTGTWSSGVRMERAAGYFCAVRTGGRADRRSVVGELD